MANIKLSELGDKLEDMFEGITDDVADAFNTAVRKAGIKVFSKIIRMTPVDTGRARGNWYVDTKLHSKTKGKSARPAGYVEANMPGDVTDAPVYLFNNLPYINTLEYGGYPQPVKKGTRKKDGSYVIKSAGGYSKQAPGGMVRLSIAEFNPLLQKYFDSEVGKI